MINSFLAAASALLNKVPAPLVQPAIDLVTVLLKSLVAGDDAAETARKVREQTAKLETVQAVYDVRAAKKFHGFEP